MSPRQAGIVGVALVGFIIALSGGITIALGSAWFYAQNRWTDEIAAITETDIPPATPLLVWSLGAGVSLVALGVVLVTFRKPITDRWIVADPSSSGDAAVSPFPGATIAVGIAGMCLAVFGVSDLVAAAVGGWVFGWNEELTFELWRGIPMLTAGGLLMLRPQILSSLWIPKGKGAA